MTAVNYLGWAWIFWSLLNEAIEMGRRDNPLSGIFCLLFSATAVWAALS